ncbi:MAG: hypothetical protein HY611_09900 [Elusimicrobia bacterium]|nr:hypothetical protein [Elusimicrobiota bacterium]
MPKQQLLQERNPFADSASMLLRVALSNPTKPWGIRELARMAGASPALAILALRRLERIGYASRESTAEARILEPAQLLRDWAAWYAIKALKDYRYSPAKKTDAEKILKLLSNARAELPGRWALTSMAGASLVAPFAVFNEVHVHLPNADELRRSWQNVLRLVPNEVGPIHLVQPYYADSGSFGVREVRKLPVVSDVQLYLDCYRYPVRGREQAEHILSQVIMPRWKRA